MKLLPTIIALLMSISLMAQSFTNKSEKITDIKGVYYSTPAVVNNNVISKSTNKTVNDIDKSFNDTMKFLQSMDLSSNGKSYKVLLVNQTFYTDNRVVNEYLYLIFTPEQWKNLLGTGKHDIKSIAGVLQVCISESWLDEGKIIKNLLSNLASIKSISAENYAFASEVGSETAKLYVDYEVWTHDGNPNNRTYKAVSLTKNASGGWFEISTDNYNKVFK